MTKTIQQSLEMIHANHLDIKRNKRFHKVHYTAIFDGSNVLNYISFWPFT